MPPVPKGKTRKQEKAATKRVETAHKAKIRADVVFRDGYCRILRARYRTRDLDESVLGACDGPTEWAHFEDQRRFKTRGRSPEERHTTAGSFAACRKHHQDYDQHRLFIDQKTEAGADGPLRFRDRNGETIEES